jgi:type II secretory pathway pseudopilin PulG
MSQTTHIRDVQTQHPRARFAVNRLRGRPATAVPFRARDERGMTVVEVLVACALMAIVTGAIAILMGTSVQSKVISASRSADTETARATLAWMSDRLRNAGFNLLPSAQSQLRCKDRVVAQDSTLLPTASSVYVSGEMLKTDTIAGDQDLTIGYYLAADPGGSGNQVVMEYNQPCSSGATNISTYSKRLSNPKINVTNLALLYFDANGAAVTNLSSASLIRQIQIISISLTVQGTEGRSGVQTQSFQRYLKLWDPEPNANNFLDLNENF